MSKMLLLTSLLLLAAGVSFFLAKRCGLCCGKSTVDLESYRKDGWFGKSVPAGKPVPKDSEEIRPFKLNISDADLQELKSRLSQARYVDHIAGTKFTYGFNSDYLKKVVEYWRSTYDWRKEEVKINAHPQFHTQIEGLDIHFVHSKPTKPAKIVLPLLAVHGWPGSFWEYHKALPLLTEPDENGIAFEVVVPSIPGYGYSEAPKQKGFDASAAARVFTKLMKRLGHEKFVVHGGDWGYVVSKMLSVIFPENTIGVHLVGNIFGKPASACQGVKAFLAATVPSLFFGAENAEREYSKMFPLSKKLGFILQESGYFHIQATKPDTVAAGLVDSPVGLAAYILEKFSTWTNPQYRYEENGALTQKFTLDELLTNIMIYWTSANIASSQRFYKENVVHFLEWSNLKITPPAGTVDAPNEIARTPKKLIEGYFDNLLQYTELPRGGHFTAFEEPELIAKDIKSFAKKVIDQIEQQKAQAAQQKQKKDEI